MPKKFLTAEWRKLIMVNYTVDPLLLQPYIPAGTEPDNLDGLTYVSLVGFMFRNTRVWGMTIPFHINFPEVNLRFYVRYKDSDQWRRGVVFIKEIVPRPAITCIANSLFRERYVTLPMKNVLRFRNGQQEVGYHWKYNNHWNILEVQAAKESRPLQEHTEEEFITEHFYGYSAISAHLTTEYQVAHPRWDIYPVERYNIDCDFGQLYGSDFSFLDRQQPRSVFLAEGSPITVYNKRII